MKKIIYVLTFFLVASLASASNLPAPSTVAGSTSGGTAAAQSSLGGCLYSTSAVTLTNGQQIAIPCTANGIPQISCANCITYPTVGSAVPTTANYTGANSSGNLTGLIQADKSIAISISTATTTQLIALSGTTKIYVTALDIIAAGTGNIQFEYGTGTNCGTGTTVLTGNYNLVAQTGVSKGMGLGPVLVVPAGNALCAVTSAAITYSGSLAYTQF